MALYEDLDRHDRTQAAGQRRSQAALAIVMERPGDQPIRGLTTRSLYETVQLGLVILLLGCWLVGAYAGIVYWAVQGSLMGVFLTAVVSGLGAFSTLPLYLFLGNTDPE